MSATNTIVWICVACLIGPIVVVAQASVEIRGRESGDIQVPQLPLSPILVEDVPIRFSPLIKNGSFESSSSSRLFTFNAPDYWTVTSGSFPSIRNTVAVSYANYLPATEGSQVLIMYGNTISQNTSLLAGQQYRLTFDLSPVQDTGSSPQDALLGLSISNETQSMGESFFVAFGTTNWVQAGYTFVAGEKGVYSISFSAPPNQAYQSLLDNVVLVAVPEPSAGVICGLGALCFVAWTGYKRYSGQNSNTHHFNRQ